MNVALIIAGGSGQRMSQDIPKQFLNVFDKPVIVYTLEGFQRHPKIDAIEVVCLDGWGEVLRAYARQFGIDKLRWITPGGNTAQESIRNGVFALRETCEADDIVVIHDGIRPMVEDFVLSDVLIKCRQFGNAVTSLPYNEQIFVVGEGNFTTQYIPATHCGVCLHRRHISIKNCCGRMKRHFQKESEFRRLPMRIH